MTPERGDRVGRFLVLDALPPGKHTTVLAARDEDGAVVSLRVARTRVGAELVEREAPMLAALGPKAAPASRLVAVDSFGGHPLRAAAWRYGSDMRTAAAEVRDQPRRMLDLLHGVTEAYAALHARGVVHGQVHPRHVLIDADGSAALLDLSLAASASDAPPGVYLSLRFNTLSAPEHARALLSGQAPVLQSVAEQFSVAALLYLMATGRMYAEMSLERDALAHAVLERPPRPFTEFGLPAWPALERVLGRALSKEPEERYASMDEFSRVVGDVALPTPAPPRPAAPVLRPLKEKLEAFRRDAEDEQVIGRLPPPRCSVNFGAAGVAFTLARIGRLTGDSGALDAAERWLSAAEENSSSPDAFDDGDQLTPDSVGTVSPFHNASGVAAVRAYVSEANGDADRWQAALDDYRLRTLAPCPNLDLTLGRSSVLLVAALLYASADREWPATVRLGAHGDALAAEIWRDLETWGMECHGVAHGYAGIAYASMMWAQARGVAPAPGTRGLLDMLAARAEPLERGCRWPLTPMAEDGGDRFWPGWCHGTAGYVFLWDLAGATYDDDRFAELAERAAWLATEGPSGVSSLCCGSAGQAYAGLSRYRRSGDERWRQRALEVAVRAAREDEVAGDATTPLSLYKGDAGLALLAVELECPERSAMPLFEFESRET